MKVIDILIGVRVSPKIEDAGLDIEEHAERAYADEDEFGPAEQPEENKKKDYSLSDSP